MITTVLFYITISNVLGTIQFPQLPTLWQDTWHLGLEDDTLTIQANSIAANYRTIEISEFLDETSVISAHMQNRCNTCHVVKELHPNVLSMQVSDCLSQVPPEMLCTAAKAKKRQYLYRITSLEGHPELYKCPTFFTEWGVSYNITYSEISPDAGNWQKVENCGQPRSELNSCFRKQLRDPQFSVTLGACPDSSLVHRRSFTQNLNCIGNFTKNGLNFVVTQGSEYEFWEENTYNAYENVYRCLAYKNLGSNLVRLVQGIGSDCNGISGELSLDNAFRTLDLQKVSRSESKCDFPLWVRGKTWKVVPRGGIRSLATGNNAQVDNQPRQVSFTDSNSFILGTEGSPRGQKFKCASVVNATGNEIIVQTFTQSQCYGEYHCFHAKLTQDDFVEIHVGAPTPNKEHSCLKPSFDLEVPYLLATLIPSQLDIQPNLIPPYIPSPPTRVQESESSAEKEANLNKIGQHAMKLLQQYQSDFSSKMQNWMREFMEQIKLLCL